MTTPIHTQTHGYKQYTDISRTSHGPSAPPWNISAMDVFIHDWARTALSELTELLMVTEFVSNHGPRGTSCQGLTNN